MRIISFFIIAVSFAYAGIVQDFINKKYKDICNFNNITKYQHNEKALSIVGVSCVKTDNLFLLPFIANKLKKTSEGRKNSIYFMTIYMEKKLIYSYLFDNFSLKGFSFPKTDYILSYIFSALKNGRYKKIADLIVIQNRQKNLIYNLYTKKDKMFVDTFKNGKLIKRRWYR